MNTKGPNTASGLSFLAIVGPPAAGKSTLCADLAAHLDVQVFRLREFAHAARERGDVPDRLLAATDAFGWFSDDAVAQLLHLGFGPGDQPTTGLALLENFPGTGRQLRLISDVAQVRRAPLAVVELIVGDAVAHARARERRACLTCEPDARGDPHRPATGAPGRPGRCANCGGPLVRRRSDSPGVFAARLGRYRDNSRVIRREALTLAVPWRQVDASTTRHDCLKATLTWAATVLPNLTATPALAGVKESS